MSSAFSPLARSVLDSFREGVVVFDAHGRVMFANDTARAVMEKIRGSGEGNAGSLMPELARLGGRIAPLHVGDLKVGEAVYLPGNTAGARTLAERERDAILQTLEGNGWKLAESAKRLGISRTTLWRRLREYGLHQDGRGRWSRVS
jgi:transcriptional regulator of acetoin/glycerol metabolism